MSDGSFRKNDLIPNVLYKLTTSFYFHNGEEINEFTDKEMFLYADDGLLHALEDGAMINPAVLQKAKIGLLPPSEWKEQENGRTTKANAS